MRRWKIFFIIIILFVFCLIGGFSWLMGTTEGARWVLKAIFRYTPVKIEAKEISGQIVRALEMKGLRMSWPTGEIKAKDFRIRWQPLYLLLGKVSFETFDMEGIEIEEYSPESKTSPGLQWPRAPGLFYWVHGEIKNVHIRELSYRRQQHELLKVERIVGRLHWTYGLLTMEKLDFETFLGTARGTVEIGLIRPGLYLDLQFSPVQRIGGVEHLRIHSRLLPAKDPDEVAGSVMLEGRSGLVPQFLIEAGMVVSKNTVTFRDLIFSRHGRPGQVMGKGTITWKGDHPEVNFQLRFSDLDLSKELNIPTVFFGTLQIEGNLNHYHGSLRIENRKGRWSSGYLSGTFIGNLQQTQITISNGSLLDGNVQGQLTVQWSKGLLLSGALRGRNLNPGKMTPDWYGEINLDLDTLFHWSQEKPPEGRIHVHLLKSHLRGQPLIGDIVLEWAESTLRVDRMHLKGKGFDLSAKGIFKERVTFHADINDLSGLIPGSKGNLFAEGWVRWRDQHLALNLNAKGRHLTIKDFTLGVVDLSAKLDDKEEAPIELKAKFLKMAYQSLRIESLILNGSGRLSNHQMILSMHWQPEGQIQSQWEGHYSKEGWKGKILQLSGRDASGDWQLDSPGDFFVSNRQIQLKSFKIKGSGEEYLKVDIGLTLHPLHGTVRGIWNQLSGERFNPWIGRSRLTGRTTGDLSIEWLEDHRFRMGGMIHYAGTFTNDLLRIELSRGVLKFNWTEKDLSAFWEIEDLQNGKLRGTLFSPQPGRLSLPERGRLEVHWQGIDLNYLQPFLQETLGIEGQLHGKLSCRWTDQLKRFGATGELKVSKGMMEWKYGKEKITRALRSTEVRWDWQNDRFLGTLSIALEEMGRLQGHFDLPLETRFPLSFRARGPIRLSLKGQFEERGLLPALFPNFVMESYGKTDFYFYGDGTWDKPHLRGDLKLTKAEFHLLSGKINSQHKKRDSLAPSVGRVSRVGVERGVISFDWDEKGLQAMGELGLIPGGRIRLHLSSYQPARMVLPQQAKLEAGWEAIDLSLLRHWIPQAMTFEGRCSGHISGEWLKGLRFDNRGTLKISLKKIEWKEKDGQVRAGPSTLDLDWMWQDKVLEGNLSIALIDYGHLRGRFHLPVAPRLPIVFEPKAPVQISLGGQIKENGLLAALIPGHLERSRSQMEIHLSSEGTWEKLRLQGLLRLKETEIQFLTHPIRSKSDQKRTLPPPLRIEIMEMKFDWDEKGLSSSSHLVMEKGGRLQINLNSPQRAEMAFPKRGKIEAKWEGMDLRILHSWLPPEMAIEGQLVGRLSGQYFNGQFDMVGQLSIVQAVVDWKNEAGSVHVELRRGNLNWNWQGDHLQGEASLLLPEYGDLRGSFKLPLAAHFPILMRPAGPIQLSLNGQFKEKGLLTAFFPGMVQESQGQIYLNLIGNGTWEKPNLLGSIQLEKAGGYLPGAGIRLHDMKGEVQFQGDQIRLTSLKVRSGPGHLEGAATLWLKNWKVSRYEGRLKGEHFQTIRLPELQVLSSPHLDFHGTTQRFVVRGEIRLPDLQILGPPVKDVVRPSPDAIVIDAPEATTSGSPLAFDIEVRLLLGEKVYYRSGGIDARLRGDLKLHLQDPQKMMATGEVNVVQGHYQFYGHKLDIVRARLLFSGGPVDRPTVDALAIRKVGEVQAGVVVAGSLQKPIIKLYSRPSMPETDILAYIVMGQPLGRGAEQIPSLAQAAGALLSAGESVVLQGQLKKMFGLDTLDITTPPGESELSRSMITIGKYLTPKLYISLGRSLFSDATLITLRYSLSKRLEVETTTGTESGATLYYKIEFK